MNKIKKVLITNKYFEEEFEVGTTEIEGRKVDEIKTRYFSNEKLIIEIFDKEKKQLATFLIPNDAIVGIIY